MLKSLKNSSRRGILRRLGAFAAGSLAARLNTPAAPVLASAPRPAGSGRLLALIGDRYHNYDYIYVSLQKLFQNLQMHADYITYERFEPSSLKSYQLFVVLRDGMIWPDGYLGPDAYSDYERYLEPGYEYERRTAGQEVSKPWISEEQGRAIQDFVSAGNGLYALHNSSHISLSSKPFREVMGGAYVGHPPLRPFLVRVTNKEHPITQGVSDFIVNDEQHYVDYDKDPSNIFLRSENIDGLDYEQRGPKAIAGWAHEYGKGRVVFTAVGHNIPAMWQPEYLKIQKNAVRWLLKLA